MNWGMIGTGRIANTFAQALVKCTGSKAYAVASRTAEKAAAFASEYGFERSYGSYRELAEDEKVDIVYIATPMSSHYKDARLCLEHGKKVLCEKSVGINLEQTRELCDLARSKGLFFMEAMWMKCRPSYLKAMEWIKNGCIGRVEYIKADFCNFVPYDENDRLFRADCGGGALLDLAVYPLTMAADVLGTPKEIISHAHMRHGVDMSNTITLLYDNACAAINSGFEIQNRNNAMIMGEKGYIAFGDWFFCSDEVTLYDEKGVEVEKCLIPHEINGYEYEIRECERCAAQNLSESPLIPHSSTLNVMKIMDECRRQWGMAFPEER